MVSVLDVPEAKPPDVRLLLTALYLALALGSPTPDCSTQRSCSGTSF